MNRQPVHTVYGGAHLFRFDTAAKLGRIARGVLDQHGQLLPVSDAIRNQVAEKLRTQAVEDLRIDFEDGYGVRSAEEETGHARQAGTEVARGIEEGTLPPLLGIRVKSFGHATRARAAETLRTFFGELRAAPPGFVVTLPKVTGDEEVRALVSLLDDLDVSCPIELMVETPEALRDLRAIVDAADGRCRGAHFGPYDFTSSCGIWGAAQGLRHPLCTHARNQMLITLAGSGIWLSDGPTSTLPVGTPEEIAAAWRIQWDDIGHSLRTGFPQGWDLHPAQLPMRYAAVYAFFAEHLPAARARLDNFEKQQQQATRAGTAFDDAATVRGLREFVQRATDCGAIIGN